MTPTKRKDKAVDTEMKMTELEQLAQSETFKQFGFEFVPDDKVPAPPRNRETDTERWNALKTVVETNPATHGHWAMIKEFDKAGSAPNMASRINNDTVKVFPSSKGWEARSEVTEKKTDDIPGKSKLYVRFTPVAENK